MLYNKGSAAAATATPPLPLHEAGDRSSCSPYEVAQRRAVDMMLEIRECITRAGGASEDSKNPARRMELHNSIRRAAAQLNTLMQETRRLAALEHRLESYERLERQHVATTQLIRAQYSSLLGLRTGASGLDAAGGEGGEPTALSSAECIAPPYDLSKDTDFVQFFSETKQNDAEIDATLDRIHTGVQRLHETARDIHGELDVQKTMLEDTDKAVDVNEAKLSTMNQKLAKTIKKLGKSRLIVYVVCCVILIVLIIVIIFLGKSL